MISRLRKRAVIRYWDADDRANGLYRRLRDDVTHACIATEDILWGLEDLTDDLLMQATQILEIATETAEDIRQNTLGNVRVSCQWCDGEFFVPINKPGPHTCATCHRADTYWSGEVLS
jgi:hypothetical protein